MAGAEESRAVGGRRAFLASIAVASSWLGSIVRAQEASVPIELQVSLLSRVVQYDRGFASRSQGRVVVLVVHRASQASSTRVARQLMAALGRAGSLGGIAVEAREHAYTGAPALATAVAQANAGIVYLAPGLSAESAAIGTALRGRSVLTVSAASEDVAQGVVLGFELYESRPRLVVNLPRARAQSIQFSSQLLRLARIVS